MNANLLEVLGSYFSKRDDIAFAFLFGSATRGKTRNEGDLDISKMFLKISGEGIPETSRRIFFQTGSRIYNELGKAEGFSELAKIRNTLAHRYLDIKWGDIKRFLEIAPESYSPFPPSQGG